MATQLAISGAMVYEDDVGAEGSIEVAEKLITLTTQKKVNLIQTVGTSAEALVLGDVSSVGFVMLKNLDTTNFVEVYSSNGGVIVGKMFPGEQYGPVRLGSGMQAPYVKANTDECDIDVMIVAT